MNLSKEQETVVLSDRKTTVVVAGPGSGKTTTLVETLAAHNEPNTVVITFTNAAAAMLRQRITERGARQPAYVGTLHGYCLRLLTAAAKDGNQKLPRPGFGIIDDAAKAAAIDRAIASTRYKGTKEAVNEALARNPWLNRPVLSRPEDTVAAEYYRALHEANLVDYDSLLTAGLFAIRKGRVEPMALYVDELQDSGEIDHEIYAALPATRRVYIGDPDQSIYGFRGGRPELFIRAAAENSYLTLQTNYRCAPEIAIAANTLIAHNRLRLEKRTISVAVNSGSVVARSYSDQFAEILGIVDWAAGPGTRAVLCRTNYDARRINQALIDAGIIEQEAPPESVEIDHVITAAAAVCSPDNDVLVFALLVQKFGRILAESFALQATAKKQRLSDVTSRELDLGRHSTAISAWERVCELACIADPLSRYVDATLCGWPNDTDPRELVILLQTIKRHGLERRAEGRVQVMTIHRSKGLEFDHVWCPTWADEAFPKLGRGAEESTVIEEERRLAFVAITRARKSVTLSWPLVGRLSEWNERTIDLSEPSRFIAEAGVRP